MRRKPGWCWRSTHDNTAIVAKRTTADAWYSWLLLPPHTRTRLVSHRTTRESIAYTLIRDWLGMTYFSCLSSGDELLWSFAAASLLHLLCFSVFQLLPRKPKSWGWDQSWTPRDLYLLPRKAAIPLSVALAISPCRQGALTTTISSFAFLLLREWWRMLIVQIARRLLRTRNTGYCEGPTRLPSHLRRMFALNSYSYDPTHTAQYELLCNFLNPSWRPNLTYAYSTSNSVYNSFALSTNDSHEIQHPTSLEFSIAAPNLWTPTQRDE